MSENKGGAPLGNDNAKRGTEFRQALKRALCRETKKTDYREALDEVAAQLAKAALKGEAWAIKEVAEREDGKTTQGIDISGQVDHSHVHGADEAGLPALAALLDQVAGEGAAGGRKKAVPH